MIKLYFFILALILSFSIEAQSIKSYVITSAGAAMMNENGAMYLSIGEPMSTEISEGEIMISQGFLNVSVAQSVDTEDLLLEEPVLAYPIPSSHTLNLELPNFEGSYIYQIYDLTGKMVAKDKISNSKSTISISDFDSGTYYMNVIKGDQSSRTLKIVKI